MEGRMQRRNLTDSLMNLSLRCSSLYVTSGGHETGQDIHSTEGHVPRESLRVEDGGWRQCSPPPCQGAEVGHVPAWRPMIRRTRAES